MGMVENGPGTVVLGTADRAAAIAAIKARLRVVSADEDALIAAFAESALELAERFIGQASVARAMTEILVPHGGWRRLGARPERTIGAVSRAGVPLNIADYAVDIDGDAIGWLRSAPGAALSVTYTAGLADSWASLPASLREGAAMLAAHLFDDRTGERPVPAAVSALWRPLRVMRLGSEARVSCPAGAAL